MSKLAALRAKRGEIIDAMSKAAEAETFDPATFESCETELKRLDVQIGALERAQTLSAASAAPLVPGSDGLAVRPRGARLKNFRGPGAEERAHRFGRFMQAAIWGNEKAADWCRQNGVMLSRAASEGVNSAGGFLVPEEFSQDIIDLRDAYGMFRRLCQVVPMGRDTINTPRRVGGLTAYAVGEGVGITQSQGQWDNVKLTASKWGVLTLMSSELDEDAAVALGDILVGEIAYAFAVAEDTAGFNGDGTSTYHGIKGFRKLFTDQVSGGTSTFAGALDAASGHDTFAEIDSTDLSGLMAKLPQYVYQRGNPTFYCSQVGWALVFQRLIIGSGGISKDDATGRVIYRYLGFDVEITPSMPTTTGDLSDVPMILFGDIGLAATFGDRRGMTVSRSTEYKFAEDQIAIKGTERFDINIHDIGDATNAGPVVALIGE